MSSGYPTKAPHMYSYACPIVDGVDIVPSTGSLQSRGCKRRYEGLQVQQALLSLYNLCYVLVQASLAGKWCALSEICCLAGTESCVIGCSSQC